MHSKIVFNIFRSPIGINWSSPRSLATSTAINTLISQFQKCGKSLGHLSVSLQSPNLKIDDAAGMERTDLNESRELVIKKKAGLASLMHNFKGQIESPNHVANYIHDSLSRGGKDLNFIEFLITDEQAKRAHEYLQAFRESKTWLNYGMNNHPRYSEGAGCTAFGISFLEIIGFTDENFLQQWRGLVRLPKNLIGQYSPKLYKQEHSEGDNFTNTDSLIPISKLTNPFSRKQDWATEDEDHVKILYYSPDIMWKWVNDQFLRGELNSHLYQKGAVSKVITINATNEKIPDEPFFLKSPSEIVDIDFLKYQNFN